MKKLIPLIAAFAMGAQVHAQQSNTYTYLVLRIANAYDNNLKKNYSFISADGGCAEAAAIYALKPYRPQKGALNEGALFYAENRQNTGTFFNYFNNTTEALHFLTQQAWELVTVISEIGSSSDKVLGGDGITYVPITAVHSAPVYYFKKATVPKQ
jgi:hypothetical protein